MSDLDSLLIAELDRLAPADEVPGPDWQSVRGGERRPYSRTLLVVAVVMGGLVLAAIATATYLALRSDANRPVANGLLLVSAAPGGVARLEAIQPDGRARTVWVCPGRRFCGEPAGMSWSPDGTRLALSLGALALSSPYVGLDLLTLRTRQITHLTSGRDCLGNSVPLGLSVDWSHDGHWIAYACGTTRIVVVHPNGKDHHIIDTRLANVDSPSWSPDGQRLVFSAGPVNHSAIYVVGVDGHGRRLLARHGRAPAWSPNSSVVAYRIPTRGSACGGLRLITADTSLDVTPQLAANRCRQFGPAPATAPQWSPDGTQLAIESGSALYVVNADGTSLRRISTTVSYSGRPAWQPRPSGPPIRYHARASGCC